MIKKFSQSYREDVEWPALQAFALKVFQARITDWSLTDDNRYPVGNGLEIDPFVYEDGEYHVQVYDQDGNLKSEWKILSYDPEADSVETEPIRN